MDHNDKALERCIARIHRKQAQKNKRNRRLLLCGIIIAVVTSVILLAGAKEKETTYTETTVYVTAGDTLWSIAQEYCPSNMDIRKYIHIIEQDNDCTATIHNGDVLTVRVY